MKMHVFTTWVLANALHPIAIGGALMIYSGKLSANMSELMFLLMGSLVLALFALPCLFISWYVFPKIIRHSSSLLNRFFVWLLAGCGMIVVFAGIVVAFLNSGHLEGFIGFIPAFIATFASICIRFKAFIKLAAEQDKPEELELN
jgi:hypothetical protein